MLFFKKIFLSQNVTCYLKVTHIKITHINCLFSSIILPSTCLDSNFHIIDVLSSLMILFFLLVLSVKKNIAISYNLSVDIHMYIPAWSNFSVYANCHFYLTFVAQRYMIKTQIKFTFLIKRPQTLIMLVFFLQFCVNH